MKRLSLEMRVARAVALIEDHIPSDVPARKDAIEALELVIQILDWTRRMNVETGPE